MSEPRTTVTVYRSDSPPNAKPVATLTVPVASAAEAGKAFDAWERDRGAARGEYAAEYHVQPSSGDPAEGPGGEVK